MGFFTNLSFAFHFSHELIFCTKYLRTIFIYLFILQFYSENTFNFRKENELIASKNERGFGMNLQQSYTENYFHLFNYFAVLF